MRRRGAMRPFPRVRYRAYGPSGSEAGLRANVSRCWRRQRLWRMAREFECDRRCASTAQACIPSSIVEERPSIGSVPTDDETDEYRVIATGNRAALLAFDVSDHALDYRDAALILAIAHAAEPVLVCAGKPSRQRLLVGGEDIEDEMRFALERRVHVVHLFDRYEDERRIERHRGDRARRHADGLALRCPAGQHRDARGEAAEQLAGLRRLDGAGGTAWEAHRT